MRRRGCAVVERWRQSNDTNEITNYIPVTGNFNKVQRAAPRHVHHVRFGIKGRAGYVPSNVVQPFWFSRRAMYSFLLNRRMRSPPVVSVVWSSAAPALYQCRHRHHRQQCAVCSLHYRCSLSTVTWGSQMSVYSRAAPKDTFRPLRISKDPFRIRYRIRSISCVSKIPIGSSVAVILTAVHLYEK